MSLLEISLLSHDSDSSEIADFVALCMNLVKKKGIICEITDTGAIIEGDQKSLFEILDEIHTSSFHTKLRQIKIKQLKTDSIATN